MSRSVSNADPRNTSMQGVAAMVVGLGMVLFELLTGFMLGRMGIASRWLVFVAGISLSIWGMKEIITTFWPTLGQRGMRFRLPMEGLVYLIVMIVLFVGSLIGRSNTLMMVFALLAGPLIMNGNMAYVMLRSLAVRRELPRRVMAGEPFFVTLNLANHKWWLSAWVMMCRDLIRHRSGTLLGEVVFMRVPPKSEQRGHYELCLYERGEYLFGPITVDTRFPFGLIERGIGLQGEGRVLVYPRIGRMLPQWRRRVINATELVSHVRPQAGPFNDEMHRIREYRTGDDPRMIHWRTSARLNELMVKEYRECRDRHLLIVVDAWQAPNDDGEAVEYLLRFAATLCMDQLRNSRETSLHVRLLGRENLEWIGEVGEGHVERLLDQFALIETTPKVNPQSIVENLGVHRDGNRRVLILSPRAELLRRLSQQTTWGESVGSEIQFLGATEEELGDLYVDYAD